MWDALEHQNVMTDMGQILLGVFTFRIYWQKEEYTICMQKLFAKWEQQELEVYCIPSNVGEELEAAVRISAASWDHQEAVGTEMAEHDV